MKTFEKWWLEYWKLTSLPPVFDAGMREVAQASWDASRMPDTTKYGCHCDIEAMQPGFEPDGCVFDNGDIVDCIYATKLQREGKGKLDCEYWKPIKVVP